MFSLRYWKDIANLLFWVLWAHLATNTRNDNQFIENFHVYLRKENQFITHIFLEILQRYANFLFQVLVINPREKSSVSF